MVRPRRSLVHQEAPLRVRALHVETNMSHHDDPHTSTREAIQRRLEALGRSDLQQAEPVQVQRPGTDAGHGLASAQAAPLEALLAQQPAPFAQEALRAFGVHAARFPARQDVLELSFEADVALHPPRDPAEAIVDGDVVTFDTAALAAGHIQLILREDGRGGLALQRDAAGALSIWPLHLAEQLPAPVAFDVPLEAWCASSADAWLAAHILATRAEAGALNRLIGAGMLARLERAAPAARDALVAALLSGAASVAPVVPQRAWAASCEATQQRAMERLALASARAVHAHLEALAEGDEAATPDALLRVCHERDELESLLTLLRAAGCAATLQRRLDEIDALGEVWLRSLDEAITCGEDVWLARAGAETPGLWWTRRVIWGLA